MCRRECQHFHGTMAKKSDEIMNMSDWTLTGIDRRYLPVAAFCCHSRQQRWRCPVRSPSAEPHSRSSRCARLKKVTPILNISRWLAALLPSTYTVIHLLSSSNRRLTPIPALPLVNSNNYWNLSQISSDWRHKCHTDEVNSARSTTKECRFSSVEPSEVTTDIFKPVKKHVNDYNYMSLIFHLF